MSNYLDYSKLKKKKHQHLRNIQQLGPSIQETKKNFQNSCFMCTTTLNSSPQNQAPTRPPLAVGQVDPPLRNIRADQNVDLPTREPPSSRAIGDGWHLLRERHCLERVPTTDFSTQIFRIFNLLPGRGDDFEGQRS